MVEEHYLVQVSRILQAVGNVPLALWGFVGHAPSELVRRFAEREVEDETMEYT